MAKARQPAERLRAKMDERGWSQAYLSAALGVSTSVVCRWLSGERIPSWPSASKIERLLGIPAGVWLAASEARRAV